MEQRTSDFGSDLDHLDQGFFKGSYSQIILGWILMIVKELSSLGGGLRSRSALVVQDSHLIIFIFSL